MLMLMLKTKIKFLISFLYLSTFVVALSPRSAQALSACDQNQDNANFYQSVIKLDPGEYNFYVKLNKIQQNANSALSIQSLDGVTCTVLGEVPANSSLWVKAGEYSIKPDDQVVGINLSIDDLESSFDASSPSILISPKSDKICADVNNCKVEFENKEYFQSPQKISLNSDTLRVAQYKPITSINEVKKSLFYIDNKFSYSSLGSKEFNQSYVGSGSHTLKTSKLMDNGQVLETSEEVDNAFDLRHFVLPFILNNSGVLSFIGIGLSLYILYLLIISLTRKIIRKNRWKKQHIASESNAGKIDLSSVQMYEQIQKQNANNKEVKLVLRIAIIPIAVLLVFILSNSFVIGRFTVDGVSMETTLHNGSGQWLFKLPVTISNINRGNVGVKRGDVVVLHHDDNNLFDETSETEKSYVVKRILGLPGERVKVSNGELLVYPVGAGKPLNPDQDSTWQSVVTPSYGNYIDLVLKPGELFVVGDNRVDSIDSRYYGPVKSTDIVGKVFYSHRTGNLPFNDTSLYILNQ